MKIGVDLLWVRPGKNGGTESYIRNLLNGFSGMKKCEDSLILFVSRDNANSFSGFHFLKMVICPVNTASFTRRVAWENTHLISLGKKHGVEMWFFPVYSRPLLTHGIPNVTVIHDLQSKHYPEYFSIFRNCYFRIAWKADCRNSSIVLTISDYCRQDIEKNLTEARGKTEYIYNPISVSETASDFRTLAEKFGIQKGEYYYTVSSLAKHKNLITLLKAFKVLKEEGRSLKLLITGVKVNAASEVMKYIQENGLERNVIYTGFISDADRNSLYDNCKTFLFPSVFEGFGMPPVEAMIRGVPVLTTKETSLYEVTQGKAHYVDDPYDENEWAEKIMLEYEAVEPETSWHFNRCYRVETIAETYMDMFKRCYQRFATSHSLESAG